MVGKYLKQQREFAQISQCELAKKTGIKQANISRWESDIQSPQIDAIIQLAQFYGISIDELVGLSDYDAANKPAVIEQGNKSLSMFDNEFGEILTDNNFIQTAKLFKAITPELRALTFGYIVGLLQSQKIDTKTILGY